MKKEKDGKVVTDEVNSSQENKEHVASSQDTGLTRREVLKKAAWMVPVILSTQLSRKAFSSSVLSCVAPCDTTCELCETCELNDTPCESCDITCETCDATCESCEMCETCDITCENPCDTCETNCENNCDWCDGGLFDVCKPNCEICDSCDFCDGGPLDFCPTSCDFICDNCEFCETLWG
ncbi:hypothetical protein GKODMF_05340 [Candidatus Electrothrix gigas]